MAAAGAADDEAVEELKGQRMSQAKAREIGRKGPQVALYPGGSGMDDEVIRQPIELGAKGAANIEVLHQSPCAWAQHYVAAVNLGGIYSPQVDGRAGDRAKGFLCAIFAVQSPNLHRLFALSCHHLQAIAYAQAARGECSGDHGARSLYAKRTVDPQAHWGCRIGSRYFSKHIIQRPPQLCNAFAGKGGDGDNGGVGKRGICQLRTDLGGAIYGGAVAAGKCDNSMLYAQCPQGIAMIGGLGLPPLISCHHEKDHWGRAYAGKHIAQEFFMARHVHESHICTRGQGGPGKS